MNNGYPPMMKMIKIQTILFALFVNALFLFGQDGQNASTFEAEKVRKGGKVVRADIIATESGQKSKIDETLEIEEKGKDSDNNEKTSFDFSNSINEFSEIVLKYKTEIFVSIIGGLILLNIQFILKIVIQLIKNILKIVKNIFIILYYFITCNSYFCNGCFAKQLHIKKTFPLNIPLKEKMKNTYIQLYEGGYLVARSKLFGLQTLNSGIYIIGGKPFCGRQCFLENELVKHNADVFEIEEDKWLNNKRDKTKTILNEELEKRLWVICNRWQLSIGVHSHKAVIMLGESLKIDELRIVVEALVGMLKKKKGTWRSINHQKLTLIIKTNLRNLDVINLDKIMKDSYIRGEKLEFNRQNKNETLLMFENSAWDPKLQCSIKDDLKKSPFYHEIVLTNGQVCPDFATTLWINTFGQPHDINNLYQIAAVTDTEHWRSIFRNWKIACNHHGISFENFLAFLWLVAILRDDNDKSNAETILENISHGYVVDARWLNWENEPQNGQNKGLKFLLRDILGIKVRFQFNFVGNGINQIDELEWAAFLMKIIENEKTFTDSLGISCVYQTIIDNLPYFTYVLGGTNDKTWEEYKEIIAENLINACIKINRLDKRIEVMNKIEEQFKNSGDFRHQDCSRIEEIAKTLENKRKKRRGDFDLLFYLEENWCNWSALERNGFLNGYLRSKSNDTEYLKALLSILPLLLAFTDGKLPINPNDSMFLAKRTMNCDIIFDLSENGQLGRVFKMPINQLSPSDKIRKYIAMKILEIIFNDGQELRNKSSYMGDDWECYHYIYVSLDNKDIILEKCLKILGEIHKFDDSLCLSFEDVDTKLRTKMVSILNLLNSNDVISQTIYYRDINNFLIAEFISISIIRRGYNKQLLDIINCVNSLSSNNHLKYYYYMIKKISCYLENVFQKESSVSKRIRIGEFIDIKEWVVFVSLVYNIHRKKNIILENLNINMLKQIYQKCFNGIMNFNYVNNLNYLFYLKCINYILSQMPKEMISIDIIQHKTIKMIVNGYKNLIYDFLFSNDSITKINNSLDVFDSYKILFNLDPNIKNQENDLYNKIYLILSITKIVNPHFVLMISNIRKKQIKKIQTDIWGKRLAINLGELIYQQIAWIFNNKSSYSNEKMLELHKNMNDLEFFQDALVYFHKQIFLNEFVNKEDIAFVCNVIANIIHDFGNKKIKDTNIYREYFFNFLFKNNKSLYSWLNQTLASKECMQFLMISLNLIGFDIKLCRIVPL